MLNKKVGILTFHNSRNYGAILQAYALQKKLLKDYKDVHVIDYRNKIIEDKLKLWVPISKFSLKKIVFSIATYVFRLRKKIAFDNFIRKFVVLSDKKNLSLNTIHSIKNDYDIYVSGSDQVWNKTLTGNDDTYFLDFTEDAKKVSYAASFGDDEINLNEREESLLRDFDFITLREEKGKCDLEKKIGKQIQLCYDPTVLLSNEEWDKLSSKRLYKGKYLFLFMIEESEELIKYANDLAAKKNLKVISNKNCMEFFFKCSPNDFLSWIKNSEYVITNSFHATMFSLYFHKQFAIAKYRVDGVIKHRIIEILNKFCLDERFIENNKFLIDDNIDWIKVEGVLKDMCEGSWNTFTKNLSM